MKSIVFQLKLQQNAQFWLFYSTEGETSFLPGDSGASVEVIEVDFSFGVLEK